MINQQPSKPTSYSVAYLHGVADATNSKFASDALDAFEKLAIGERVSFPDFADFMRQRDWYINGTFNLRCKKNGLEFVQEGRNWFVKL